METTQLIKGLMQFQARMPVIGKDAQGHGYRYASLDSIIKVIVPIMQECGLAYSQPVGGDGINISVTTTIYSEDGGSMSSTVSVPIGSGKAKMMSDIQGAGSVITYLRRYSISSMLGLVVDEDTDGAPIADNKPQTTEEVYKECILACENLSAEKKTNALAYFESVKTDRSKMLETLSRMSK